MKGTRSAVEDTPGAGGLAAWQLDLVGPLRVRVALDAGCGLGRTTAELRRRYPTGAVLALDIDADSVRAARRGATHGVRGDIARIPVSDESVDLIVAGHVLYSPVNLEPWLVELRRGLRDDGVLLAATNSSTSARRLLEFHAEACRRAGHEEMARRALEPSPRDRFTLENGLEQLREMFGCVRVHTRDDDLEFAGVEEALQVYGRGLFARGAARIESVKQLEALGASLIPAMRGVLEAVADREGAIVIPRRTGAFVARR